MKAKIEQIIKDLEANACIDKPGGVLEIPLRQVKITLEKYFQDTTEDKPTVATVLAYEQGYKEALSEVASILKKEKCVGVPYRNGIERGIEVAEELLANSV